MVKLSSVAEILNGDRSSNYPSGKDFIAYGIPFINAGHLKNGKIDFSNMDYISKQKYEQLSGAKIQKKDILLCLRGSLGKYAVAEIDAGAPASSIAVIRPNETIISSEFLTCIISSFLFQKQIDLENNGSSQPNLSASSVANFIIPFPPLDEQKRIAEALSDVDELISSLEKLIEKYKSIKATCLQQMFPQKGETTPKMRLPGFTGAWEQRKFSEIVETRRGLTYKPSDICENGVRVLRSSNIDDDSFVLRDDDVFVKAEAVNIDYTKENDILITAANGSSRLVGKHAIIGQVSPKSTVHGGFMLLGATKEPYFVNASMGSSWYRHFIELFVSGGNGAIGNLNKNDLDNQDILVPSEEERQKIGVFFKQLDNLITLHQRKLNKAKKIKQGMMQQLLTGKIRLM